MDELQHPVFVGPFKQQIEVKHGITQGEADEDHLPRPAEPTSRWAVAPSPALVIID